MREEMTLAELAEESGVSARTIRFYIARGLVDGPLKAGRGAFYNGRHLERLEEIKKLQAQGRMLGEIAGLLVSAERAETSAPPSPWWQHVLADDIVVWTRADVSPWRTKQLRAVIEEMAARVAKNERRDE